MALVATAVYWDAVGVAVGRSLSRRKAVFGLKTTESFLSSTPESQPQPALCVCELDRALAGGYIGVDALGNINKTRHGDVSWRG